jgi:hypothetical protein
MRDHHAEMFFKIKPQEIFKRGLQSNPLLKFLVINLQDGAPIGISILNSVPLPRVEKHSRLP